MMAMAGPSSTSSFLPLLESLEDSAAGHSDQTDAYLTIANRLSGEEGRQFLPAVEKHFSRLGKATLDHITSPNAELSQAALQALGFCVYHSRVVSGVPETFATEILSTLCSLVVKSTDKNTCTRALWVISKQNFPPDMVARKVPSILAMLENVWSRKDVQSVVMEHEALNVVIRMLEQVPVQMGDGAVRWAKLVIPLVVHSASKVRLRAAAAMEMGMPLLLEKQTEVAAIIEPMMSSKLIPELQKLFMSKNETNVLKLWPLFIKLLGKLLHRGGPFINSLLHLEELGFRSSSPTIKKIAFIAWKSLIDNFALNPDILCSSKRMKLLMQPLTSINVRAEALLLTKVEVWWYLVVQLGPNLSANFDQVSVPLLQCTIGSDSSAVPGTPSRAVSQNGAITPGTPKTGTPGFNSPANTSRLSLNSSVQIPSTFPSIQLLGLEMLLHYFLGPEVIATAAKHKLILSLEPLSHTVFSGTSTFSKHAAVFTSNIRDGFINIGKEAPAPLLSVIWRSLVQFVNSTIESVGYKKDRHGSEPLTLVLQALQSIIASEALPADKVLILFEATVNGIPQRVLGSASYQVGKMDVLNGTPALFLILLLYNSSMLSAYLEDDRFFQCLQTLVGCGLSGPTSSLAFGEAVLGAIVCSTGSLQNKEQLWRMWSVVVCALTDTISQSNEVNQGDALEHNFSAMHSALLFPITHLLPGTPLQQATQKSMLSMWSKLYKVFARCSALVVTAEENICCEELCAKMITAIDTDLLKVPSTLNSVASILQVMVECVDFSPYTPQFQQKLNSPHTPVNWMKKRNKVLGNLSTFQSLLVQCLEVFLDDPEGSSEATGLALITILSVLFTNLALANNIKEALTSLIKPLTVFYEQAASESPKFPAQLLGKLEKLLCDILGCLQTRSTLAYHDELLALLSPLLCVLFPHKNKQLRNSVTQFWNSTFANSVSLVYPDEIRPILSQVKQKTPIILPGFEVVCGPDELSGPYSSESSQLETKLSGMPVLSVGKRDSLLGKVELKERSSITSSKPVSTKLDFSSPKPPRREVLEDEASIDFVFIPPETKERVLTEHQKEVKRTKRVDIPAMYNNLDASLDTTVFTQYTQSQEDSVDKLQKEQTDINEEAPGKVSQEDVQKKDDTEVMTKVTQDYVNPNALEHVTENKGQEEMIPVSKDISMKEDANSDDGTEALDMQSNEASSPNISGSSDLISGTPQKPNSRRQSFITLEKYGEGTAASPSIASTFTGPLIKTSNSQDHSNTTKDSSPLDPQSPPKSKSQCPVSNAPRLTPGQIGSVRKCEPVRLTERMSSNRTEEEDIIPDTQTEVEETLKELKPSSQEEDSDQMDDCESSLTQEPPGEPRRSGRQRVKPLLSDPEDQDEKHIYSKSKLPGEPKVDSPNSSFMQSKPKTRSKQGAEEDHGKDRLRTRAQRDKSESSKAESLGRAHKKIKLYSNSQEFVDKPERRRRSTREHESSQTDLQSDSQSDYESQSQGRYSRRRKSSMESKEESIGNKKVLHDKEQSSQTLTQAEKGKGKVHEDSQTITASPQSSSKSQEHVEHMEKDNDNSQMVASLTGSQSQEVELIEKTEKDYQEGASPINTGSPDGASLTNKLKESKVKGKRKIRDGTDVNSSQEASQTIEPLSSDGKSLRRSRRSKASYEATESEEKTKDLLGRQCRSNSQAALSAVSPANATVEGRSTRSKVHEELSNSSPLATPQGSQSLQDAGSTGSSRGRGKYVRRKSSQALVTSLESSGSESLEARENTPTLKKRTKKLRTTLSSPLTIESKEDAINNTLNNDCDTSEKADTQTFEAENATKVEDSPKTQDLMSSASSQVTCNIEEQRNPLETPTVIEADTMIEPPETENEMSTLSSMSPSKEEQGHDISLQQSEVELPPTTQNPDSVGIGPKQTLVTLPCDLSLSAVDTLTALVEIEKKQDSKFTEEKVEEGTEKGDGDGDVAEKRNHVLNSNHMEQPVGQMEVVAEDCHGASFDRNQMDCTKAIDEFSKEEFNTESKSPKHHTEAVTNDDITPLEEGNEDDTTQTGEYQDETVATNTEYLLPESTSSDVVQGSLKDLEAVMGPDVGQSPSSGRTRGTWSPSASPSNSILKKCHKRQLEDETLSPLVKSRRVSFADPIQHQETADDIDRRSPAIRTSSPRRAKNTTIPQPKFVTTPTKGLLILSPRNLHKSSKKCLISEMSQEPRPVSRDCIYPALVGCSTPVEAVLPQISSTMWSRGFGQLVRARNIKTVGDLSALTPSEIKTLPIRSPKISNVKKALKIHEQQRKGRGVDELKSFDETEMMTSELETSAPKNQYEEKTSCETLATALVDDPDPDPVPVEQDDPTHQAAEMLAEQSCEGALHPCRLLAELEALTSRLMPSELRQCSPQQLVQMHDQLGGVMRRVVVELQTRLCQMDS